MDCPHCHRSDRVIRKGSRSLKNGDTVVKYACNVCQRYFSSHTGTALFRCRISLNDAKSIVAARSEGVGVRAAGRLTGHSHSTVIDLERRVLACTHKLDPDGAVFTDQLTTATWECDEVYTRIHHNRPVEECPGWTALGIERSTRLLLPSVTGRRNYRLFDRFGDETLPLALSVPQVSIVSDGERRYTGAVTRDGEARKYLAPPGEPTGKGRQLGSTLVWRAGLQVVRKVKGSQHRKQRGRIERPGTLHPDTVPLPDKAIHANHCEALNAALRRRCSAMRRRTNTYAKKVSALDRALTLYRRLHNWCRGHFAFRGQQTPAMAIGLTNHIWTVTELLLQRA